MKNSEEENQSLPVNPPLPFGSTEDYRREDIRAKQIYEEVLSRKMSTRPTHEVMDQLKAIYGL